MGHHGSGFSWHWASKSPFPHLTGHTGALTMVRTGEGYGPDPPAAPAGTAASSTSSLWRRAGRISRSTPWGPATPTPRSVCRRDPLWNPLITKQGPTSRFLVSRLLHIADVPKTPAKSLSLRICEPSCFFVLFSGSAPNRQNCFTPVATALEPKSCAFRFHCHFDMITAARAVDYEVSFSYSLDENLQPAVKHLTFALPTCLLNRVGKPSSCPGRLLPWTPSDRSAPIPKGLTRDQQPKTTKFDQQTSIVYPTPDPLICRQFMITTLSAFF